MTANYGFFKNGGTFQRYYPYSPWTPILALMAVVLLTGWAASPAWGSGFALTQQGTAAMAMGNAYVAQADDPTAIFYNPAGLTQLTRPALYLGTVFNAPDREYHGPTGYFSQTKHVTYHTAQFYLGVPINNRVTVGLGLFNPFGLGSNWPADWQGRYLVTNSSLKTFNVNPVVAVKVLDNLSVAVGVNGLWSSFRLKKRNPMPIPALPDGEFDMGGDGFGVGYNFGILYAPVPDIKLGVNYRSEVYVKHHGELTLGMPAPLPSQPVVDGSGRINFPPSLTAGIAYLGLKTWVFEFDCTWTGWSSYDVLEINLARPIPTYGNKLVQPKYWKDAWAIRFGASYKPKPDMTLRAGYIFDMTPVPSDTMDPQVPDSNRHLFTVGGDLKVFDRFTLGIAYNYILAEPRHKDNLLYTNNIPVPVANQVNGLYKADVHSLAVSLICQF
jgi:long-chain fatty acid transport protein